MIDNGNTELYYLGDIENNPDFVFDWGSCTKVITWVSVMQLVEQGKLDPNADIRTCLPEGFLTRLKYDEPITMLNLMNHDAGFQDMSADLFTEDKSKIPTLAEALKKNQPPQIRKPGEVVAYSNFGAALAGYIVECVSGQDYGDYVISNIFSPLGMVHTSIKDDHSDNQWVENQ
jgi:CubicO group peptidase (beta-lactamase class C family)